MTEEWTPTAGGPGSSSDGNHDGGDVKYDFMTVKAIRGREGATKTKWQNQGWEFVNETQGTLRSELNFRKVKSRGPGAYLAQGYAAFRRLEPKTQKILLGVAAGVVGVAIAAAALGGGDAPEATEPTATESETPSETPSPEQTTEAAEEPEVAVVDITVDELVDKLNSPGMGGIKVGDQFRLTGELVGAEYWGTGASGDHFVTLKTKSGSDLIVFVNESDATAWKNGTKVEMVVEMSEATINGETTDGWLRAQSVKTVTGGTTEKAKEAASTRKMFKQLRTYADVMNTSLGRTVIDSIEPSPAGIDVFLNPNMAGVTVLQARTLIAQWNENIVDTLADAGRGASDASVKYYLAGQLVAQNKEILDPWSVDFKGMLDQ